MVSSFFFGYIYVAFFFLEYQFLVQTRINMMSSSRTVISPLPIIKNAAESEKVAADARMDRMTIWMRNVESTSSKPSHPALS